MPSALRLPLCLAPLCHRLPSNHPPGVCYPSNAQALVYPSYNTNRETFLCVWAGPGGPFASRHTYSQVTQCPHRALTRVPSLLHIPVT